jgi:two-component system, chemotaxis family, protein-glutamate methylesterase/glutaminase
MEMPENKIPDELLHAPVKKVIVMGGSSGSLEPIFHVLSSLSRSFLIPVVLVVHLPMRSKSHLAEVLRFKTGFPFAEPEDKQKLAHAHFFSAPPNYHLMIEKGNWFSYSYCEPENFSRPSIDVLFDTAAKAMGSGTIGVLFSGANADGSAGMRKIMRAGGTGIVQDPASAEFPVMPRIAITVAEPDLVLTPEKIAQELNKINDSYTSSYEI